MTGFHHMYSDIMYDVTSKSHGPGRRGAELIRLHEDFDAFKQKTLTIFWLVCTCELFAVKFRLLGDLEANVFSFEKVSALDASTFEQFKTRIKTPYRYMSKRPATRMDEMVSGLNRKQLLAQ